MNYLRDGRVIVNARVPMRDGVELATTVYLPPQEGRFPVVLSRTAYNRMGFNGRDFTKRGLVAVSQDVRGRYASQGEFEPFIYEENDGLDTLDWIAQQPWCDGRVGMFGPSYLAFVQLAIAAHNHPAIAALAPCFMGDGWQRGYYCDGAFSLALSFSWLCLEVGSRTQEAGVLPIYDVGALMRELPLLTLDEKAGCGEIRAYRDYVAHETGDEFWDKLRFRKTLPQVQAPVLSVGGWYDYYAGEAFLNYQSLLQSPAGPVVADNHRVVIGPWTHGFNQSSQLGEIEFGPDSLQENDVTMRWLECLLKGGTAADFQAAPIRLFVMGTNQWRDEYEWPLQRTQWANFYLRSDGILSREAPQDEPPDHYVYDPNNPTPTLGGNHSVGPYNPGLYEICLPGPYDQRSVEARDEVLVYTTDELEKDVEVTGPIVMRLFAASSARDTDFVARLCDVYPDGRSINITEGVLRARYRGQQWSQPQVMEPDEVYEFEITLQATSNVFFKGHRIRLQLTSSNFPLWDRNLNTGEPCATAVEFCTARQTIHHDAAYPSHLILPLIPCGDQGATKQRH